MSDEVEQLAINTQNGHAWWSNQGRDSREVGHNGLMNRLDAQKKAGLLFHTAKEPIERKGKIVDGHFYTVRTDTDAVLGVVGKTYQPIQNDMLFDVLEGVVAETEAVYESAGSLSGGRRVFALAKLPQEYFVAPGDWLRTYFLIALGHDGSLPYIMAGTDVRVVCKNTENLALRTAAKDAMSHWQSIKNTINAKYAIERAKRMIGLISTTRNPFIEAAQAMVNAPMSAKYLENYVQVLFPSQSDADGKQPRANVERQREIIRMGFEAPINNIGQQHTAWSAYQALTDFVDHGHSSRQSVDRQDWSWFGDGVKLRNTAFNWLMDYPVAGRELELVPVMNKAMNDPWEQLSL